MLWRMLWRADYNIRFAESSMISDLKQNRKTTASSEPKIMISQTSQTYEKSLTTTKVIESKKIKYPFRLSAI